MNSECLNILEPKLVLDMTIIVRSNPSKAAILEEFLHGTQEKLGIAEKLGRYGLGVQKRTLRIS